MLVVDTNVLVYAANHAAPEHARSRALLESLRASAAPWYLTWGICFEFLRVVTHPRVLERPWHSEAAWAFLRTLFRSPSLRLLTGDEAHADVVDVVIRETPALAGNLFHDAETVALMRAHGLTRIITRDTDFHRFPGIVPLDPLVLELP